MRYRIVLVATIVVASIIVGCETKPTAHQPQTGDTMIVYVDGSDSTLVYSSGHKPLDYLVPVGSRVTWIEGGLADKNRGELVRVKSLEGKSRGEVFLLQRERLRAVAAR